MGNIMKELQKGCKNIGEILDEMIEKQRIKEITRAKTELTEGVLEEELDDIENNYLLNKEKVDYAYEIFDRDIEIQRKFIEMIKYIDDLNMTDFNTFTTMLTTAVMLYKLEDHPEFIPNNQLFVLSTAMVSIPVDDYNKYGDILLNRQLLDDMFIKTDDQNEQRNMCYEIFDYCDEEIYDDMTKEEEAKAINDCLNIVKNYKVVEKEKTNRI